jgi:glucose/arabinose dehydrogenase
MSKLFLVTGIVAVGVLIGTTSLFPVTTAATDSDKVAPVIDTKNQVVFGDTVKAALNYKNFCSGCHGDKMDAFVDRVWKHGTSKNDLFKAIKVGYEDEGMPGFDTAFTDQEITDLSEYMLTGIQRFKQYQFQDATVKENYFPSENINLKLDTVVKGLKSVWGMAFLPHNEMLITEKGGKLFRITKKREMKEVKGVPEVLSDGQGGLLDVVLHPGFKKNKLVYLSYSATKKEEGVVVATTAILCAKLNGDQLTDQKIIFEAFPYSRTKHHYGSRMVFSNDGYLFFSVGERGNEKENPQTLTNDLGKIHRINDNGSIPADNPFVNTPGARTSIYSYGHRNPQGLVVHPKTGEIWSHEHGPRGGDEINLVKKAANYGWPAITYGINYNGKIISKLTEQPGMEQPLKYWIPSIGPSGMAFVTGKKYKAWDGQLLSGSLRFKYLNLSYLNGKSVVKEEMLLKNLGRLRDVRLAPDGYIYVSVENPGYVFRLIPVK